MGEYGYFLEANNDSILKSRVFSFYYFLGFDGTSNVLAGKLCGIPVKGTQAHAFITSFTPKELPLVGKLQPADSSQEPRDFYPVVMDWLKKVSPVLRVLESEVHMGELAAFSAYAVAFPDTFLALVDTYDVTRYCWISTDCIEVFSLVATSLAPG